MAPINSTAFHEVWGVDSKRFTIGNSQKNSCPPEFRDALYFGDKYPGMLWPCRDDHENVRVAQSQHDTSSYSTLMGNEPSTEPHMQGERFLTCPVIFSYQLHPPLETVQT